MEPTAAGGSKKKNGHSDADVGGKQLGAARSGDR